MSTEVPRLPPSQCWELIRDEGYLYLDVRAVVEFEAGHPAGAYNVPVQQPGGEGMLDNPAFVAVVARHFEKRQGLVLGCRSGNRSQTAARLLQHAGYTKLVEQRAGFDGARGPFGQVLEAGWQGAGLPCTQHAQPGRDYKSLQGHGAG